MVFSSDFPSYKPRGFARHAGFSLPLAPRSYGPCLSLAPFDGGRILDTKPAVSWVYIDFFNWDRIIVYVI